MRRIWKWTKATRKHRILVGTAATFLVAASAFAFYATILSGGSGDVSTQPFAATPGPVQFTVTTDAANPMPTNLQPGTTCSAAGPDCGQFNLIGDNTANNVAAAVKSVTLTGITLPAGCPAGSLVVQWPQNGGDTSGGDANDTYTYNNEGTGYANPALPANGKVSLFGSAVGGYPYLWFKDDGQPDQSPCASGTAVLHFTATTS